MLRSIPVVKRNKLKIAYTLGDLAGIGEEIFFKFKKKYQDREDLDISLIDDEFNYQQVKNKIQLAKVSAEAGEHSYKVLQLANQKLLDREFDFLITGPVAKESLWLAGVQCSGQTELLARLNGLSRDDIEMIFILEELKVVLATRHVPITHVPELLEKRLARVIANSITALKEIWQITEPDIAVAALNPHAGENGIIGLEENKFMRSIVEQAATEYGLGIEGPFPADSLFAQMAQKWLSKAGGLADLYIAAYHDQALPLIKGLGGLRAINLTAGLPYIRLSVDHGTGFDIVSKAIASPLGLEACTDYCFDLDQIAAKTM